MNKIFSSLILAPFLVTATNAQSWSLTKDEPLESTKGPERYETAIGTLIRGGTVLEKGTQVNLTKDGMEAIGGFVAVKAGHALALEGNFRLLTPPKTIEPPPTITLLYHKHTGIAFNIYIGT